VERRLKLAEFAEVYAQKRISLGRTIATDRTPPAEAA